MISCTKTTFLYCQFVLLAASLQRDTGKDVEWGRDQEREGGEFFEMGKWAALQQLGVGSAHGRRQKKAEERCEVWRRCIALLCAAARRSLYPDRISFNVWTFFLNDFVKLSSSTCQLNFLATLWFQIFHAKH